jgi:hypothetical protein
MTHALHPVRSAVCAALLGLSLSAGAATLNESTAGDFSNDRLVPTLFTLDTATGGDNLLSGSIGRVAGVVDRDYIHVVVPEGFLWTGLRVGAGTTGGGGAGSFIGLASGATMPVPPNASDATGLLGWTLYGAPDVGSDLFDLMSVASNGSTGFTVPLAAGSYTLWMQELATGSFPYSFNLTLAPVPEPASALMLLLGLGVAGAAARRTGRTRRADRS